MILEKIHDWRVTPRRRRVLAAHLASLIPDGSTVLDVGSGDGSLAREIQRHKTGVQISGIDVLARGETAIPVTLFDGETIPFEADTFDVVMFVDVLHHATDPRRLLTEAARVTKRHVLIKDHNRDGTLAGPTLRFMDWMGNARFGVALPYNYWSRRQWMDGYARAGLRPTYRVERLGLYPFWANWLFGRRLHSIVLLEKDGKAG
jgi:SAM-dependent methyltransferase